jgi:hypothetical protein
MIRVLMQVVLSKRIRKIGGDDNEKPNGGLASPSRLAPRRAKLLSYLDENSFFARFLGGSGT